MMHQETYVNLNDLRKQGWMISEIAAETGWHRTTISKYLRERPPTARATEASANFTNRRPEHRPRCRFSMIPDDGI